MRRCAEAARRMVADTLAADVPAAAARRLLVGGLVLGVGLGGFFDGIVFHQVLQIHHLVSEVTDETGTLILADGLFHLATYAATVAGVGLVWRVDRSRIPRADRRLVGSVLAGWGSFNLADGLVNHHLLGIHHTWPAGPGGALAWDLAFLAWGVAFLGAGALLARPGRHGEGWKRAPEDG